MTRFPRRASLLALLLLATCAVALVVYTAEVVRIYGVAHRGVSLGAAPGIAAPAGTPFGVNVRLHEEPAADAPKLLETVKAGGYGWVRQEFPWSSIEPAPAAYEWAAWDRIVELARERGLRVIAVVDTSPAWARGNPLPTSPPDDVASYARFVGALAGRYRGRLAAIQVWDEPNISPHWGPRYVSASEYTLLLRAAFVAIRAAEPQVPVLAGGLAPTTEQSEWNQSDVTYLEGMYRAGAQGFFDALAAKPYGFWTGPDDRRVDAGVLNFSRVILLRETMERHGDGDRAIWAVEMGWNALPVGWTGRPSPWGSDTETVQADRSARALARARSEWPWLAVMALPALDYRAAAADDPVQGFALLGAGGTPRAMFEVVRSGAVTLAQRPAVELRLELSQLVATLIVLLTALAVVVWLLIPRVLALPWAAWTTDLLSLPDWAQGAALAASVAAFCLSPWPAISLAALPLILALVVLRLDWGLAAAVFLIPFAAQTRRLVGGLEFSPLEVLLAVAAVAWALREFWARGAGRQSSGEPESSPAPESGGLAAWWAGLAFRGPDLAVLSFVALGLVSLAASADVRLAARELRLVVVEPAILYFLLTKALWRPVTAPLRAGWPEGAAIRRMVIALLAGAAAASALGLFQYLFTAQVITAEGGLRRMLGPYPSPNGLGLIIERALPLALALALAQAARKRTGRSWRQRSSLAAWAGVVALFGLATLLTFSVGAWAAAAAGCGLVVLRQSRRTALAVAGAALVVGLLAIPLLGTERVASHFDLQSATTSAVRVSVWQSAVEMIADHPLAGVGLDGFLDLYRTSYIRPEAWREPDLSHPHNVLLESWLSLGILGPVAYAWLVGSVFVLARRARSRLAGDTWRRAASLGLAAGLAAGLAHGMVDRFLAGAPDLSAYLFLCLGLLVLLAGQAGSRAAATPRVGESADV
jgi:O-antigen ligase